MFRIVPRWHARISWERLPRSGISRDGHLLSQARPAFVPAPCPGEIPTLPTSTTVVFATQLQPGLAPEILPPAAR